MLLDRAGSIRFVLATAIVVTGVVLTLHSQDATNHITVKNIVGVKNVVSRYPEFLHPPQWSGGALIGVDGDETPLPMIVLLDREGYEFSRMYVKIPDAKRVSIFGQARGTDGTVAVGGTAADSEGRVSGFVAILSANGETEQITQTGMYIPFRVAMTPDGSVWTAGRTGSIAKNRDMWAFHRFDKTGKMIGSFVPTTSFSNARISLGDPRNSFAASSNRVAFLCYPEHRYIEISLDGKVTDISLTTPENVRGFALTSDGKVFFSAYGSAPNSDSNFYVLDPKSGQLLPVSHGSNLRGERLSGVDGDMLVTQDWQNLAFYKIQH